MGKQREGFTLIELMLVVGIIGILASVAIPTFSKYKQRVYDAEAEMTLGALHQGAVAYWNEEYVEQGLASATTKTNCITHEGMVPADPSILVATPVGGKFIIDFSSSTGGNTFADLGMTESGAYHNGFLVQSAESCSVGNSRVNSGGGAVTDDYSGSAVVYLFLSLRKDSESTIHINIAIDQVSNGNLVRNGGIRRYENVPFDDLMSVIGSYGS